MNAMQQLHIVAIAILLGVIAPCCSIAGPSPRHVDLFYDELSPAAGPKQKDTEEKDKEKKAPEGHLEMRGETLEWMDLRHPGDGFEIRNPGPEKVWTICKLRPSESFCHQLDLELLAVYSSSSCSSA